MFEYKFVEIPIKKFFTSNKTNLKTKEVIRSSITENAKEGWRFVQCITQVGEGLIIPDHYELVFEKRVNLS